VGLSFAKGIGGLRGKNDKGEWANVSLKGKPLGQGFQVGKVGPVEVLGGEPAFKSCGQQCTFVSAKKGEDLLPRGFADVGERVWHFEGRDVILAKDNQGRWSYLFAESGEPLTGSWYTRVDEPSTANALFTFVATKISGQSVYLIVTPEGNTEEKPASAAKDSAPN
jgi:hypothetical protein